ncbi:MAG: 16S rRNA (uracil(1498)-N(3))-methyltransferase [Bacteroidales bacterium]|nr:16S rRNA (uracil(1498)-N(3))-methyltransferase [Bacteroidales bacterium]
MELFYAYQISDGICLLDQEESSHCVRVLRHRSGDLIDVIDGRGTLYHCRLQDASPKGAQAAILSEEPGWGSHPYNLTIGCCPTKNNDRFEWFVEKATEIGVDRIVPLIGDRSERKVYKTDRARRIAVSAAKQSLKAAFPDIAEPVSVRSFVAHAPQDDNSHSGSFCHSERSEESLRLIAYCFEDGSHPRKSIQEALDGFNGKDITILIGPEGDFSPEEAVLALEAGYIPVHLGTSRLRTETAAVTAATAVYLHYMA